MRVLLLLLSLSFLSANASQDHINDARFSFPEISKDGDQLEDLVLLLKGEKSALGRAYRGAFILMSAEHTSYPLRKYNRFTKGRDILDLAIDASPSNPEIRYIRILIQSETPSFLNYSKNIDGDVKQLIRHKKVLKKNSALYKRVRQNLLKLDDLSTQNKKLIRSL